MSRRRGLLSILALAAAGGLLHRRRGNRRSGTLPAPTEVNLLDPGETVRVHRSGAVASIQKAEIVVPRQFLESVWTADNLELLARGYWAFLRKIFLGIVSVHYAHDSRTVMAFGRIPLLRFGTPLYETGEGRGRVTWPIDRGVLVAREGRGEGHLRVEVQRCDQDGIDDEIDAQRDEVKIIAGVAVENFYPGLRGRGQFSRLGAWFYAQTQLRIHVLVCNAYLRSLPKLEFPDLDRTEMPGDGQPVGELTGKSR